MGTIARLRVILAAPHPITGAYNSDTELARAELYTKNVPDVQPLSMSGFRDWASVNSRGFKIRQAIDNTFLSDQERNIAYIIDKLLGTDLDRLDPGNPNHVQMINELVGADIINAGDRTALIAGATVLVSVVQKESLGHVALCDIVKARA